MQCSIQVLKPEPLKQYIQEANKYKTNYSQQKINIYKILQKVKITKKSFVLSYLLDI